MIYFVEDDDNIRKLVSYALTKEGYAVLDFARPSLFWAAIEKELPELLLLDIMLPEEDGLSILTKLRDDPKTKRLPIMMLTAKGSEYDKVTGLDRKAVWHGGADRKGARAAAPLRNRSGMQRIYR